MDIKLGQITHEWAKAHKLNSFYTPVCESTNTTAKENSFKETELENELVIYLTDSQTAGRGRFDRQWSSGKAGSSLISSWSFLINETPQPEMTARVGLALINALRSTWAFLPFLIKAPNDIYLSEKKCAGILVETVSQGDELRLVIGVGLNVLSSPAEIETASSIFKNLPSETPLTGEDWILFLDRFLFELTTLVPLAHLPLSSTEKQNFINQLMNPVHSFEEINWNS